MSRDGLWLPLSTILELKTRPVWAPQPFPKWYNVCFAYIVYPPLGDRVERETEKHRETQKGRGRESRYSRIRKCVEEV